MQSVRAHGCGDEAAAQRAGGEISVGEKLTIDEDRKRRAAFLRGLAAVTEMVDSIGGHDVDDHVVAKVLVDNEMDIRSFLKDALKLWE